MIASVTDFVQAAEAENASDDAQIAALQTQLAGLNAQIVAFQAKPNYSVDSTSPNMYVFPIMPKIADMHGVTNHGSSDPVE